MNEAKDIEVDDKVKFVVRETIGRIAIWVKSRKVDESVLTKDATMGFNLACDFLSHELLKMQEYQNLEILNK